MTLDDIVQDIHVLEQDLQTYERKYGVLSETFYESYLKGEEPADDAWVMDWSMWAGAYEIWLRRHAQYPDQPALASTHPHHKHVPPDIKHNRIPAPEISFEHPNLPFIIAEIENLN